MNGLYRAKFHDCSWAFGFYANRKETTYCFVEDYERQVELLKSRMLGSEEVEQLKMVTVAIDLLFGIDVSYYTVLSRMFLESKIVIIYNYFNENIDYNLNDNELCTAIKRKGYGK